jgi:2-polyprenyl-3-methyl-5-hydroxy-6-metoxy-1,4-benzoquinol methylase
MPRLPGLPGIPPLRERAADLQEQMDGPDCDPYLLERTYAQFGIVNAFVSGWRRTYAAQIRPQLSHSRTTTLLDIGSGGGDIPRALVRWADSDGYQLEVTAIDPDERAHAYATSRPPVPGLTFRRAFSADLVREGASFDLVTSNHMLHHLTPDELAGLLRDSEALCRARAVHSDLRRSPVAYGLFSVVARVFRRSYIRQDGLTSIRRSYTDAELRAAVPPQWHVSRRFPFINLLVLEKGNA